jgi:hypothetical protein
MYQLFYFDRAYGFGLIHCPDNRQILVRPPYGESDIEEIKETFSFRVPLSCHATQSDAADAAELESFIYFLGEVYDLWVKQSYNINTAMSPTKLKQLVLKKFSSEVKSNGVSVASLLHVQAIHSTIGLSDSEFSQFQTTLSDHDGDLAKHGGLIVQNKKIKWAHKVSAITNYIANNFMIETRLESAFQALIASQHLSEYLEQKDVSVIEEALAILWDLCEARKLNVDFKQRPKRQRKW